MNDPDLVKLFSSVRWAARLSPFLLIVPPVLFGFAAALRLVLGSAIATLAIDAVGMLFVLAAAVVQMLVARGMLRDYPHENGARWKILAGVFGTALAGILITGFAIIVLTVASDWTLQWTALVPGAALVTLALPSAVLLAAAFNLAAAERTYGPAGAVQLWHYQASLPR